MHYLNNTKLNIQIIDNKIFAIIQIRIMENSHKVRIIQEIVI